MVVVFAGGPKLHGRLQLLEIVVAEADRVIRARAREKVKHARKKNNSPKKKENQQLTNFMPPKKMLVRH